MPRRTACDNLLCKKALDIAKNPKYDGHQHGLASLVYKFFDKKEQFLITNNKQKNYSNQKENLKNLKFIPLLKALSATFSLVCF